MELEGLGPQYTGYVAVAFQSGRYLYIYVYVLEAVLVLKLKTGVGKLLQ